jgi:hypothetical protein
MNRSLYVGSLVLALAVGWSLGNQTHSHSVRENVSISSIDVGSASTTTAISAPNSTYGECVNMFSRATPTGAEFKDPLLKCFDYRYQCGRFRTLKKALDDFDSEMERGLAVGADIARVIEDYTFPGEVSLSLTGDEFFDQASIKVHEQLKRLRVAYLGSDSRLISAVERDLARDENQFGLLCENIPALDS